MSRVTEFDLEVRPPWSGGQLARLGVALINGEPPPAGCPAYAEVMDWHADLCAQVAAIVYTTPWESIGDMPSLGRVDVRDMRAVPHSGYQQVIDIQARLHELQRRGDTHGGALELKVDLVELREQCIGLQWRYERDLERHVNRMDNLRGSLDGTVRPGEAGDE